MGSMDSPRQDQMNQDRDIIQDQEETELGLQIRLQQRWVQPVAGPETNCLVWASHVTGDKILTVIIQGPLGKSDPTELYLHKRPTKT